MLIVEVGLKLSMDLEYYDNFDLDKLRTLYYNEEIFSENQIG